MKRKKKTKTQIVTFRADESRWRVFYLKLHWSSPSSTALTGKPLTGICLWICLWTHTLMWDRPLMNRSTSFPRSERLIASGGVFHSKTFHLHILLSGCAPPRGPIWVQWRGWGGVGHYQWIDWSFTFVLLFWGFFVVVVVDHYFEEIWTVRVLLKSKGFMGIQK